MSVVLISEVQNPFPDVLLNGASNEDLINSDNRDRKAWDIKQSITQHVDLVNGGEIEVSAYELSQMNGNVRIFESNIKHIDVTIDVPATSPEGVYVQSICYGNDPANCLSTPVAGKLKMSDRPLQNFIAHISKGKTETISMDVNWTPENLNALNERRKYPFIDPTKPQTNKPVFQSEDGSAAYLPETFIDSEGVERRHQWGGEAAKALVPPVYAFGKGPYYPVSHDELRKEKKKLKNILEIENWGIKIKFLVDPTREAAKNVRIHVTAIYKQVNWLPIYGAKAAGITLCKVPKTTEENYDEEAEDRYIHYVPTAKKNEKNGMYEYDSLARVFYSNSAYKSFMKKNQRFCTISQYVDTLATGTAISKTDGAKSLAAFLIQNGTSNPNWAKLIGIIAKCIQFYSKRVEEYEKEKGITYKPDEIKSLKARTFQADLKKHIKTKIDDKFEGLVGHIMALIEISLCSLMEVTTRPCKGKIGCDDETCENTNCYGEICDDIWDDLVKKFEKLNQLNDIDLNADFNQPPVIIDEWILSHPLVHDTLFGGLKSQDLDVRKFYSAMQTCVKPDTLQE